MKKKILIIAMALALVSVIAMPMAAFAASFGTSTITGNVSSNTISISAFPTGGSLGSLVVDDVTSYAADQSIIITGSGATYNLKVRDDKQTGHIGHMTIGPNFLAAALKVKGADLSTYTSLPEDTTTLTLEAAGDLASGTSTIDTFNVQQAVSFADPAATGYSITLYFEVSYN